jgi:SAM-dependent methyltransferase
MHGTAAAPASVPQIPVILTRPEGNIEIQPLPSGRFSVTLRPRSKDIFIDTWSCETSFPPEMIEFIAERCRFGFICDALGRHDNPDYIEAVLRRQLFAYFAPEEFEGKRLLDFGCGGGASTFALAAMLPKTEIVGVELDEEVIQVARRIAEFRKMPNLRFLVSPSGDRLPSGLGKFDFVMFSAVYEHLLPSERTVVMPLIWSAMKTGAALFINQTPHRYFPYEHHSTGLWLINYLPDRAAHFAARKFSRYNPELNKRGTWTDLLRGGIRGGTEREIMRNLRKAGLPRILQPKRLGLRNRADYWLSCTNSSRLKPAKLALAALFRMTDRLAGTVPSINIDVVIRKDA